MGLLNRKPKRRRDKPKPIPVAFGGLAVIAALLGLAFMATRVYNGVPGRDYMTVFVSAPQVGNLLSHDPVRIGGARVGQVLDRTLGDDGRPRIELQIEPGTGLTEGTTATFRAAGLLGARFVELEPTADGQPLADGATIKGGVDSYTFGLPETFETFDTETQGGLGEMIRGFGQGLSGQGAGVNDSIRIAGNQARPFAETAQTILEREGAAARLVPALASAAAPLDANRRDLAGMAGVAADAVTPFVTERDAVRALLDEAPPTLAAIPTGLESGERLLAAVGDVARATSTTLPGAPTGLSGLAAMLEQGPAALDRTTTLLRAAEPAIPGVIEVGDSLGPVLEPLRRTLRHSNPILETVGRYECDIRNFGVTMRSMTGFTQPGEGPGGPSEAFRLQIVAPLSSDLVGVKDAAQVNNRRGVVEPCTFLSGPYPQAGEAQR